MPPQAGTQTLQQCTTIPNHGLVDPQKFQIMAASSHRRKFPDGKGSLEFAAQTELRGETTQRLAPIASSGRKPVGRFAMLATSHSGKGNGDTKSFSNPTNIENISKRRKIEHDYSEKEHGMQDVLNLQDNLEISPNNQGGVLQNGKTIITGELRAQASRSPATRASNSGTGLDTGTVDVLKSEVFPFVRAIVDKKYSKGNSKLSKSGRQEIVRKVNRASKTHRCGRV